jgi:hypothetical protein
MNIQNEAEAIFKLWVDGFRVPAILSLRKWDPLIASAISVQLVLMLFDNGGDLPEFIEILEHTAFSNIYVT